MKWLWSLMFPLVLATVAAGQQSFPMTCHPFQAIEVQHPIDSSCGLTGKGTGGSALQNQVKNNFCAGTNYQTITQQDLVSKQAGVAALPGYARWDGENMPPSRSDFTALGEGSAVQFIGYILEAHYADLTGGESVNCNVSDDEASNDIHIALVPQSGTTDGMPEQQRGDDSALPPGKLDGQQSGEGRPHDAGARLRPADV